MFSSLCSRLITPLVLVSLLGLSGCAGIRQMKEEKNMLQARTLQLEQDLEAEHVRAIQARDESQKLLDRWNEQEMKRQETEKEVSRLRDQLAQTQRVMNDSQASQAEALKKDLDERLARENELKLEVERLNSELEQAGNVQTLLETNLREKSEEFELARVTAEETAALFATSQDNLTSTTIERDNARAERDDFQRQVLALQSDQGETAKQLEAISNQVSELEKELATTKRTLEETQAQVAAAEKAESDRVAGAAALRTDLASALKPLTDNRSIVLSDDDPPAIILETDVLFNTGTVLLSNDGEKLLREVAATLENLEYTELLVAGHTDNVPVKKMPFVDNWDLAGARAAAVTRWLAANPAIPASKLRAVSHAFFAPIASNETPEGRSQNRRVELVVVQ